MHDNLLSFVSDIPDTEFIDEVEPGSIWDKLLKAIAAQVKMDGIRKESILSTQNATSVTINASENVYYDVAEFYDWYFDATDERNEFMRSQKAATILSPLRAIVKPVVEYNLSDMRKDELIPAGSDYNGLTEKVTDDLTRYILNWQDWYYDRKEKEELDDYWFDKSLYEEIYVNSDYGDFSNLTNYLSDDIDNPEDY